MDSVSESITIRAAKAKVFDAFVIHINEWWPFQGKHSYSFAPEQIQPKLIQFEAGSGGRFYETFANGEEYQIGEIRDWQPPDRFSFTWKGEEYTAPTLVEVLFAEADGQTKVTLTHSGWEAAGVGDYAEGYGEGWAEILGKLEAWLVKAA
jgi:uncharacterized protein YndB with AHSA1/START domain